MSTPENLRARAGWGRTISESRQNLLSELTSEYSRAHIYLAITLINLISRIYLPFSHDTRPPISSTS